VGIQFPVANPSPQAHFRVEMKVIRATALQEVIPAGDAGLEVRGYDQNDVKTTYKRFLGKNNRP
jgi:hypothetical protein